MRIVSRLAGKSFIAYQFMEHILLTVLVTGGIPMLILFAGGRHQTLVLAVTEYATKRPVNAAFILGGIVILFNLLLALVRKMRLVVGLDLDGEVLTIQLRSLLVRRTHAEQVPLSELVWSRHGTHALFPITNYKGYRFFRGGTFIGDLFIDHFTWEGQEREVNQFLRELDRHKAIREGDSGSSPSGSSS